MENTDTVKNINSVETTNTIENTNSTKNANSIEGTNTSINKWIILSIVITMSFMAPLDSNIVNIALPVLTKDLGQPLSSIQWIVISYLMVISCTLLIFGRLGDIFGKSRLFKFGMIFFIIGSFLCAISTTFTFLLVSRVIQAIGGAAYMANNQGIITQTFGQHERGKALGILGSSVALGTMAGPPIGGLILANFSWNYIFWVNIPIGIVAFIASVKFLPKGENTGEKLDIPGSILFFFGILLFFGSLSINKSIDIPTTTLVGCILAGLFLLIVFAIISSKKSQPLLKLDLFKNKLFSLSLFCGFVSYVCIAASVILIPFYLENTLKLSTAIAGGLMMISPIVTAVISPLSGRMSDKVGSESVSLVGLIIMTIGFALLALLKETSPIFLFIGFAALMSLGQAIFQPANNSLIMSCPPRNQLGVAGSINSLIRNLGQVVGVTLSTTLLYTFMSTKMGANVTDYISGRDDVFIFGMSNIYYILAGVCFIGVIGTGLRFFKKKTTISSS